MFLRFCQVWHINQSPVGGAVEGGSVQPGSCGLSIAVDILWDDSYCSLPPPYYPFPHMQLCFQTVLQLPTSICDCSSIVTLVAAFISNWQ